jgi:hypothetical protein
MQNDVARTVKAAIMWLEAWDFKTLDYFIRVLMTWVNDLYNGDVTEAEFVDRMADVIDQQLTRAWNEGMRENGLDPIEDMTDEYAAMLQDIIANEYSYVDEFAASIKGGTLAEAQARAQLWAARYQDVVNQAKIATAEAKDKFIWRMGATEVHCDTCAQLDGVVAYASEWETAGIHPQQPPNGALECGGWRCDCSLEPTDQRRSPKALDILLTIGIK